MTLPVKTMNDILDLGPCYNPTRYAPEDWTGTALDVLRADAVPIEDRFWVVLHEGWIDDKTLRLFAVWCARKALALIDNPDPRSIAACDVAERYANGDATSEELAAARAATWAATWDAARAATWAAASTAAWAAALDAAWAAARAAAWDAARDAQINHLIEMLESVQ